MVRTRIAATSIALCLLVGRGAAAQSVAGTVVDAASAKPVVGATISVLAAKAAAPATARTNDSGKFQVAVPTPGAYTVKITRIGYTPSNTDVRVEAAGHTAVYRLTMLPVSLAPVTATAGANTTFSSATPGRELYRQNMLLNTGQMASGLEIQQSRLTVTEFLGQLIPGLKFVKSVAPPAPGSDYPNSPATIPGGKGFVVATNEQPCLFARVDRWGLAGLLDQYDVANLDEILQAADVMGVEVYSKFSEVPPAYRAEAQGKQMVWRTGAIDRNYFVGDLGAPAIMRPTLRANPGEAADSRTSPIEVRYLRGAGQLGAKPPLDTLWEFCKMSKGPDGMMRGPSSVPQCTEARPMPDSVLYKITARLVPIDTVRPPSFALPSMTVPQCGFVQIWTRIAW